MAGKTSNVYAISGNLLHIIVKPTDIMHYYNLLLVPVEHPDTAIPASLTLVPRRGDLISNTKTGGRRHFEVLKVYAHEPATPGKQGDIQVLVRDVAIPNPFAQPQSQKIEEDDF